ncbi:MAG: extracellular solute-binding protein [Planctomycetota bacterium]
MPGGRNGVGVKSIYNGLILLICLIACEPRPEVVIYTAHDPVFSRAILTEFERRSGIRVLPVFDTEATKTVGLAERLRRERKRPRCDIFWNNETLRTIRLAQEGLFEPYLSPAAEGIPPEFRDVQGLWTGFAARARAIAFDPDKVDAELIPHSHEDLLKPVWRNQIAMGNPRFGTTGSHLAFLFAAWGEPRARKFLLALRENGVQMVGGNSTARDRVLSGEARLGLTDTDDIEVVRRRGASIAESLFAKEGTVVLPNSVALVKGAPHPEEARALLDFLLSEEVEAMLAASPSRQIPLRRSVAVPPGGLRLESLRRLPVTLQEAAHQLPIALRAVEEIWP